MNRRSLAWTALAAAFAAIATPASALKIELIDVGGVAGSPAEKGFAVAANYWESVFSNNAVVKIEVGFSDLGPDVLGGTSSQLYVLPNSLFMNQLAATGNTAIDAIAVANLPTLDSNGALKVITPGYVDQTNKLGIDNSTRVFDADGSLNNRILAASGANLKAIGFGLGGAVDANIQFSSTFAFDFDPSNGIATGSYDFIGVAIHEIGHALGFLSGADDYDYLGFPNGPLAPMFADYPVNDDYWGYAADLFRYSNNPDGFDGGGAKLDWAPGSDAYFSLDMGASAFWNGNYSTGNYNGDGWQASHWKQNGTCANFLGIMNPYICNGVLSEVTALDLALFDSIGWNTNFNVLENPGYEFSSADALAAVPEPGSLVLAGIALIALGGRASPPSPSVT